MCHSNYHHVLYEKDDFIKLDSDAVEGIKGWRFTEGGTDARAVARVGNGGGIGYSFRSQPHVCFCEGVPCKHKAFTGTPTEHKVLRCTQEKVDREQATAFFDTIKEGTPLASKGDLDDTTAGNEPLWLSIAKGKLEVATAPIKVAGGTGSSGMRTINTNWAYVDIQWLVKIKIDSEGNVHYEAWSQPHGERTALTKPKILCVPIELQVVERRNAATRYVMSAATYQRLVEAVKPH